MKDLFDRMLCFRSYLAVGVYLTLFGLVSVDLRAMPENLNGNARLTLVSSRTDTLASNSLNQNYSINWSRQLGPYVRLRASMRYHRLGINQGQSRNSRQQKYQPGGELVWRHPYFTFSGSYRHSLFSNRGNTSDLIRDNISLSFKSRLEGFPIFNIRVDGNRSFNDQTPRNRDTREWRTQFGLKHTLGKQNLHYSLTHSRSENLVSQFTLTDNNHIFRWNQTMRLFKDRMRLSSGYSFNHRSQTSRQPAGKTVFVDIPLFRALYIQDATPEVDQLEPLNSLFDGNTEIPVQPQIDIGDNVSDINLGVDLGLAREVAGLYIYTDRPSGPQVVWQVYVSRDNYTWSPVADEVLAGFNVDFNRYEVLFATQKTRYIKAVKTGFNDAPTVLVTEIAAVAYSDPTESRVKRLSSHLVDLSGNYLFSDRLTATFDLTLRTVPVTDFSNGRETIYYSFSLRHSLSARLTQNISFQTGYDRFTLSNTKNANRNLSYNVIYIPLETLDFTFSAVNRISQINDVKDQEINSALLHSRGKILESLSLNGDISFSRYNRFGGQSPLDTWSYSISSDASLTRSLETTCSYLIQKTDGGADFPKRTRTQFGIDGNYRMTRFIFLRGHYIINNDNNVRNRSQEYTMSWVIGTRMTLSGSMLINDTNGGSRSERAGLRLNYTISSRSTINMGYSSSGTSMPGDRNTASFQMSIRTGF